MKRIRMTMATIGRSILVTLAFLATGTAQAREIRLVITPVGPAQVLFDPRRHACDGHDVPDAPFRAYRDGSGGIVAFGLHYENRRLMGPSIEALKLDCKIVFRGSGNADPAAYDDRSWITATWTHDGIKVHALAHHEYQANTHKGRCAYAEYMKCWWNSVLALQSDDSGAHFAKATLPVMAASPEPSEVGQGRHRGFFNPSNIVEHKGRHFVLIGTTGWPKRPGLADQPGGVCLFKTRNIADPAAWRAYSGTSIGWRFPDPYLGNPADRQSRTPASCQTIAPFPAPVGSITRHRASGAFVAIFQAAAGSADGIGGTYPASGFYAATSRDLVRWSPPSLVLETKTLYDNACGASFLRSYPVLVDPQAQTRNFEDTGDTALLLYSEMRIEGCSHTSDRKLVARKLRINAITSD